MTKREEYGLLFNKKIIKDFGFSYSIYVKFGFQANSYLTYLGSMGTYETQSLIYDLNASINNGNNYEEDFFSDSTEMLKIVFDYPNIKIENQSFAGNFVYTIPMQDLKEIMEEWLVFIS